MTRSIGITGMDPQTGAALTEALKQANATLGGAWRVVEDQNADFVFVDMDSVYGPMSWIRLHADGKRVIGVTSANRTLADFHLSRPFDATTVTELLRSIAQAPAAATQTGESAPNPPASTAEPTVSTAATAPVEEPAPVAMPPAPAVQPEPEPEPEPTPLRNPVFVDWMAPGALNGQVRYRRGEGPALLIDADIRQYHGPAALKPLADAISGTVLQQDFTTVPAGDWPAEAKDAGEAQPLARLQWYAGLVAGNGNLLPGHDPQGKYRLIKWPQTEREFPKHFRIATVMMKAPATLPEIAEGSGVTIGEVNDFVNANLATGYAEAWREPEPEPEPQKTGGLFGRLRGR